MRSTRKLSLKKEVLTELSNDDLSLLAGAANVNTPVCYTSTCECTEACPSNDTKCVTIDTCTCGCTYRTICGCYVL